LTIESHIAVFPILADMVEGKTGSRSTAHWRIHFIRLNRWLRHSFAQLITLLDIDGIDQNWEDSNTSSWLSKTCTSEAPGGHTKSEALLSSRGPILASVFPLDPKSSFAVCSILPVWVGTERNHDGLSAIYLAG